MHMKKRHPIKNSEIRDIIENLKPDFGSEIEQLLQGKVETAELESGEEFILVDEKPVLIKKGDSLFPFITAAEPLRLKKVTVDMGAIEPISSGADIMAPGVVDTDPEIEEGEIVGIEDEKNHKILAIGRSLKEGSCLTGKEGKVIENIHHVGDDFWSFMDEI